MNIIKNKFYYLVLFLIGIMDISAGNGASSGPPSPPLTGKTAAVGPPPPPGLPIDDHIIILFLIAVVFGTFIIYRHLKNIKNSI